MIRSLRESKAKLSELVETASRGEDVLISVRGRVKARLIAATGSSASPVGAAWARELRALQKAYTARVSRTGIQRILNDLREDRF
jgi:prevent-host-death family protein